MTDLAVAALTRKRAELAGEEAELERSLERVRESLRHLDATILLLDPTVELAAIKPKRPPADDGLFGHGELTRLIYRVLRGTDRPPTLAEITAGVMVIKGMDPKDGASCRDVRERVSRTLRKKVGRVLRRVPLDGGAAGWAVADP
jgi:hypothetical protein